MVYRKRRRTLSARWEWAVGVCSWALAIPACSSDSIGGSPDGGTRSTPDGGGSLDSTTGADRADATDGLAETAVDTGLDGTSLDGGAEGGGSVDAVAESSCDASATVPDFTRGAWLICDALDVAGKIWTGTLTITSETPTCDGASIVGSFSWLTTNLATYQGTTVAHGSYVAATQKITLDESQPTGNVASATDVMTYDPGTDRLVNGSWTGGGPAGMWSSAARVPQDAGNGCIGDF